MTNEQFGDARTLAAYWLMADDEKRRQMWSSDIKKICEALLANPAPVAQEAGLREATLIQERDRARQETLAEYVEKERAKGKAAQWKGLAKKFQREAEKLKAAQPAEDGLREAAKEAAELLDKFSTYFAHAEKREPRKEAEEMADKLESCLSVPAPQTSAETPKKEKCPECGKDLNFHEIGGDFCGRPE